MTKAISPLRSQRNSCCQLTSKRLYLYYDCRSYLLFLKLFQRKVISHWMVSHSCLLNFTRSSKLAAEIQAVVCCDKLRRSVQQSKTHSFFGVFFIPDPGSKGLLCIRESPDETNFLHGIAPRAPCALL